MRRPVLANDVPALPGPGRDQRGLLRHAILQRLPLLGFTASALGVKKALFHDPKPSQKDLRIGQLGYRKKSTMLDSSGQIAGIKERLEASGGANCALPAAWPRARSKLVNRELKTGNEERK
jgi:hypothetical protein